MPNNSEDGVSRRTEIVWMHEYPAWNPVTHDWEMHRQTVSGSLGQIGQFLLKTGQIDPTLI